MRKILLKIPMLTYVFSGARVLMVCLSHTLYARRNDSAETKQWREQNAEKATHIKGRLLEQAVFLLNCVKVQWRSQNDETVTYIKGRLLEQAVIPFN